MSGITAEKGRGGVGCAEPGGSGEGRDSRGRLSPRGFGQNSLERQLRDETNAGALRLGRAPSLRMTDCGKENRCK